MQHAYRDDLAYIHDAGFGHLAMSVVPVIVEELKRAGSDGGTVVEFGCGSGVTSRLLHDAGYKVIGFDLSESLILMARKRVPGAVFQLESFVTADIPSCVAVTAIGEVLNYTFDSANGTVVRAKTFERVYRALAPGGLFVFDTAGPARAPSHNPERTFSEGRDWAVMMEVEADTASNLLTRRITTFRKQGDLYRRDFELHQLQLVDPLEVVESLQRIGFSVQTLDCYGSLTLPRGLIGFVARKPTSSAGNAQQVVPADALARASEL
ncbi:MAG: class I SAM-dependent methyltransferase [Candidatus Competibacter sp.]|nr:class I SAM-dependent methyltransferase [Candidatus Competibacter sp.]